MADSASNVKLELPRNFVGQLLEGLSALVEEWEQTATQLEHDQVTPEPIIVRDCNDAREAKRIAEFYRRISHSIEDQLLKHP